MDTIHGATNIAGPTHLTVILCTVPVLANIQAPADPEVPVNVFLDQTSANTSGKTVPMLMPQNSSVTAITNTKNTLNFDQKHSEL